MILKRHLELRGKHAFLSPSKHSWIHKSVDEIVNGYLGRNATDVGTALHELAEVMIGNHVPFQECDHDLMVVWLLSKGIKMSEIEHYDLEAMLANIMAFINDAIMFGMDAEVVIKPVEDFDDAFGTADAIRYDKRKKLLRVHDYKSGSTPASMDQLKILCSLLVHGKSQASGRYFV